MIRLRVGHTEIQVEDPSSTLAQEMLHKVLELADREIQIREKQAAINEEKFETLKGTLSRLVEQFFSKWVEESEQPDTTH